MPLNKTQKDALKKRCNQIKLDDLTKFVLQGDITLEELPGLSPERRAHIENAINSQPNPQEQSEWQRVTTFIGNDEDKYILLQNYVHNWEHKNPPQNHLSDAAKEIARMEAEIVRETMEKEKKDWENLNTLDKKELEKYLGKYPSTVHYTEIMEMIWGLVDTSYRPAIDEFLVKYPKSPNRRDAEAAIWKLIDKEDILAVRSYIAKYPESPKIPEAKKVLDAIAEWDKVKNSGDIFTVIRYISHNSDSPFFKEAELLKLQLKRQEIEQMKADKKGYNLNKLQRLLSEGVILEHELFKERLATPEILSRLGKQNLDLVLPDIGAALANAKPSCPEGYTDVFFFGIPSTGKTCVLMGLTCSDQLSINLASYGGDYAEALQSYTEFGKCPPSTPGDYVSTIQATVNAVEGDAVHKLNLIEMSGEEFAFEIARHEKEAEDGTKTKIFNFDQMGTNATRLLQQPNRKVFFLIIDPTVEYVVFKRNILTGYDEQTGEPLMNLENCSVRQKAVIQRMVNLFGNEENREIMKRVDSIHVIITKADLLGDTLEERNAKAKAIIDQKYQGVLAPLYHIAKDYNINVKTDYRPMLYTFSLGNFYLGGMYEYDNNDSNRLVKAIRNATAMARKKTWWEKFCDKVN